MSGGRRGTGARGRRDRGHSPQATAARVVEAIVALRTTLPDLGRQKNRRRAAGTPSDLDVAGHQYGE